MLTGLQHPVIREGVASDSVRFSSCAMLELGPPCRCPLARADTRQKKREEPLIERGCSVIIRWTPAYKGVGGHEVALRKRSGQATLRSGGQEPPARGKPGPPHKRPPGSGLSALGSACIRDHVKKVRRYRPPRGALWFERLVGNVSKFES